MVCNSGNIISKGCLRQVQENSRTQFLEVWRSDKKPLKGKFQGVGVGEGASKAKAPTIVGGGMDIFLNYTMRFAHS